MQVTAQGSVGTSEAIIIVIILGISLVILYGTVVGLYRAAKLRRWGWFWAILLTWIVGLGWLVGWAFVGSSSAEWNSLKGGHSTSPPPPPPPPTAPAGWYPDPQKEKPLRYFDGVRWTEHTSE